MKVLVAEDDIVSAKVLQKTLEKYGHEVVVARSGEEAWQAVQRTHYPLVLSDWMMPGLEGPELCRMLRERGGEDYTYFIILTAKGQRDDKLEALKAGADDFLSKPLDREELYAKINVAKRILDMQKRLQEQSASLQTSNEILVQQRSELENLNMKLSALATTDGLTGIPNHRAFQDRLSQLIAEAQRGRPFSLAMVDVDKFKQFNDDFGHQAGDDALIAVASTLQSNVRRTDFVARYGGEEFCLLITDTSEEQAAEICEKLREAVSEIENPNRRITVSIGVASFGQPHIASTQLIEAADQALYDAKQAGRNRVHRSTQVIRKAA